MARLGLAEAQLEKYPHQISGGQARRVAIARALVAEPSFLIADEPTAGLDVSVQGELLNLLADLQKSFSLGILIVSHNLNVIGRVTDRVAIMYLGKVVEEGPTRAVFRAPRHPYTHALLSANPVIDPEHKRQQAGAVRRDPEPVASAARLPLPHALPASAGALPRRGAAADAGRRRPPLRLPFPAGQRGVERLGIGAERPVLLKRCDDRADAAWILRRARRRASTLRADRRPARPPSARRRSAAATARSSRRIWRPPAASARRGPRRLPRPAGNRASPGWPCGGWRRGSRRPSFAAARSRPRRRRPATDISAGRCGRRR